MPQLYRAIGGFVTGAISSNERSKSIRNKFGYKYELEVSRKQDDESLDKVLQKVGLRRLVSWHFRILK
jgi:hypothetical protein